MLIWHYWSNVLCLCNADKLSATISVRRQGNQRHDLLTTVVVIYVHFVLASTIQVGSVSQTDWLFNLQENKRANNYHYILGLVIHNSGIYWNNVIEKCKFHSYLITLQKYNHKIYSLICTCRQMSSIADFFFEQLSSVWPLFSGINTLCEWVTFLEKYIVNLSNQHNRQHHFLLCIEIDWDWSW